MHNKDQTSCFLGKVGTIGVRTSAWNSLAKMSQRDPFGRVSSPFTETLIYHQKAIFGVLTRRLKGKKGQSIS